MVVNAINLQNIQPQQLVENSTQTIPKERTGTQSTFVGCPSTCDCGIWGSNNLYVLDCLDDPKDALPALVLSVPHIVSLTVLRSHLTEIPCEVSMQVNMFNMIISYNDIETMDCNLSNLTNLRYFDMSYNKIQIMPCQLLLLPSLRGLDLSSNNITALPCDFSNVTDLAELNLSRNAMSTLPTQLSTLTSLTSLDVSHNQISEIPVQAFMALRNVSLLFLNDNELQVLHHNITDVSLYALTDVKLGDNPWVCNCQALVIKYWMIEHGSAIKDNKHIICKNPPTMLGKNVMFTDRIQFCPNPANTKTDIIIITSVASIFLVTLCILFLLWPIKRRRFIRRKLNYFMEHNDDLDDDKTYDIFVSYAEEDVFYIEEELIPELENLGFKVCYHRIHFIGGRSIIDNISESINNSKRTLAFLSTSYKDSHFCMWEYREALSKDLRDGTTRLVTIKATDVDIDDLDDAIKAYLERFTYIEKDAGKFWENLLFTLPKRRDAA